MAQARGQAGEIVAAAQERAAASLRDASRRADVIRMETRQQLAAVGQAEAAAAVASAHREARNLGEQARQRTPTLASQAVRLVRALADRPPGPAGGRPGQGDPGGPA